MGPSHSPDRRTRSRARVAGAPLASVIGVIALLLALLAAPASAQDETTTTTSTTTTIALSAPTSVAPPSSTAPPTTVATEVLGTTESNDGELAHTGIDPGSLAALGLVLIGVGAVVARRSATDV